MFIGKANHSHFILGGSLGLIRCCYHCLQHRLWLACWKAHPHYQQRVVSWEKEFDWDEDCGLSFWLWWLEANGCDCDCVICFCFGCDFGCDCDSNLRV
jgi:hypothetical protein